MQIQNNTTTSFGKLNVTNDIYHVIKTPTPKFNEILNTFTKQQARNKYVDVFVDNYKNMRIKFWLGDSINKIWNFEKGPSNFLCLNEKNIYNYELRDIIANMKCDFFIPGEYEKITTNTFDETQKKEINKQETKCITPNYHRVGEYLPQKYHNIPRLFGCTPIEATFLLRLRKYVGFASYFNDILEIYNNISPQKAFEYINSHRPRNKKGFIG